MNHAGGVEMHENQGPGSYESPQTTLQRFSPSAHRRSRSQQQGKSSGNSNLVQSRQNMVASEVSPVLVDPGTSDPDELLQSRVDQFYGHGSEAGRSRSDLQNTFPNRNRSKRGVSGQGSRELSVRELVFAAAKPCVGHDLTRTHEDDDDEGRYWSEGRRENRGASRMFFITLHCSLADVDGGSVLNVGDGYNRGGPSRNPSRTYFLLVSLWRLIVSWIGTDSLRNPSRDHLGQFDQSGNFLLGLRSSDGRENDRQSTETSSHDRSGIDQPDVSNEMLSGQISEKDPTGMSAHLTGDPSRQYFTLDNLRLVLNLIWVLEHESPAGTEGVLEVLSDP